MVSTETWIGRVEMIHPDCAAETVDSGSRKPRASMALTMLVVRG